MIYRVTLFWTRYSLMLFLKPCYTWYSGCDLFSGVSWQLASLLLLIISCMSDLESTFNCLLAYLNQRYLQLREKQLTKDLWRYSACNGCARKLPDRNGLITILRLKNRCVCGPYSAPSCVVAVTAQINLQGSRPYSRQFLASYTTKIPRELHVMENVPLIITNHWLFPAQYPL